MQLDLLEDVAARLGVTVTSHQKQSCKLLLEELQRWNSRINLTAITEPKQLVIKHLADSMELIPFLEEGENLLDIGSGAGFPAVVLAVFRPDCHINSLDSVAKKINFQRHVKRLIRLPNLTLLNQRVEDLIQTGSTAFSLVTSRAFSSMEQFLKVASPLLTRQGRIIAMRSRVDSPESDLLPDLALSNGLHYENQHDYDLAEGMGGRSLVIFAKRR